jgi:DNA-binding LacI/PurR family transcriptional regulator
MPRTDIPLYEQLYNYVVGEIRAGKLKSGDRVLSEKELAAQFKVSRITSKKALEKLELANLIERSRGKGSFVVETLPDLNTLDTETEAKAEEQTEEDEWGLVGLILPDFSATYGLDLVKAIEGRCTELKYHVVVRQTYGGHEEEAEAIRSLVRLGVEGLIIWPVHGEYYNAALLRLILDGFPVVLVDRYLKGIPASAVYTNNRLATQELTEFLLDQGHENIAFVSPPLENTSSLEERAQGFMAAFSQRGISLNPSFLFTRLLSTLPGAFNNRGVTADADILRRFFLENPQITAFVACEYNVALIVSKALKSLYPETSQNYTVACFDSPEDPFEEPLFTHIKQDEYSMGRKSVDIVRAQIAGEKTPLHTIIEFKLVPSAQAQAGTAEAPARASASARAVEMAPVLTSPKTKLPG